MNKIKLILFFVLVNIYLLNSISAQSIRFNHLTVADGLSQNAVTCILQDSRGFMWFGTQDGLNRFDGYAFKVFKNNPDNPNSISDNFIFTIYEDADSNLFFRTISGKLNRYFPLTESFTIVNDDSVDLHSTHYNTVLSFYYDKDSVEWRGGAGRGTGLKRVDKKNNSELDFRHDPLNTNTISNDKVYSILRDSKENIWIGTANGLDKLDESTGKFKHYKKITGNENSISDNFVWPIFEDSRGLLWIGTVNGGLNSFDPVSEKFLSYRKEPTDPTSISDNFIFSIYEDRSGLIWIGTNTGGISYFNPASQNFVHFKKVPNQKNSLSSNDVRSIHVDRNGIYWIGTDEGLEKFDYNKKSFRAYKNNPKDPNSIVNNPIQLIYEDSKGTLWLGTFNGGLVEFNRSTNKFRLYKNDPGNNSSLSDDRIYSLYEDKQGILWVGTYGGGLNKFDKESGKFTHYINNENDSTSLSFNSVWSIIEDRNGTFWIGTYGGGVNVFDRTTETFKSYKHAEDKSSSLSDDRVIKIFEDSAGNIWIGTMAGLNKYDPANDSFRSYTENDGLSNNVIFGIVEDNNKNLWLSTYNGISKFDVESEQFQNYYYHDGLQSNEFNQNAYASDSESGRLLFGGPNGLNIFDPAKIKTNTYIPPIVFTEYKRYNSDDKEGKAIIETGITARDEIVLTHKDNIVSFGFSALSFSNNFMNQYKYKLNGFNETWIQLEHDHVVTFTNLSPGDYVLNVTGSNNNGVWNDAGKSLKITVNPPWWRTNIAYVIYGISILSLLFGVRRVEIKRREQKAFVRETELLITAAESEKRALKAENERKTQELEDARNMQLSMLPKVIPQTEELEIAVYMRTATEVGGDYYDFLKGDDGTLSIAFGDATGHGLQAGTMVTLIKGFFTSYGTNSDIKSFFERSNKTIKDIKLGRIMMAFILMKIRDRKMIFSSAGMPPLYYYDKSKNIVEELMVKGMPLGAMSKIMFYDQIEKELNSGDMFMLFSDGLPEQMNEEKEMYDYPRFKEKFESLTSSNPQAIVNELLTTIDSWRGNAKQDDDISLMVVRVK